MNQAEKEHLGVKIPKKLNKELCEAVQRGDYLNKSDLVRAAIRSQLDQDKEA